MSAPAPRAITLVVAMNLGRYIGKDNQLLWRLPTDLKRFKALTTGGAVVMGRKTYESIGKPLPNRMNIVVSRNMSLFSPYCEVVPSIESAVAFARASGRPIFVIGGGEIYRHALPLATHAHVTVVFDGGIVGDVTFPSLPQSEWWRENHEVGVKTTHDEYPFEFMTYKRVAIPT
ncbi:dihydrofolate reductase [Candidatus Kaiserbacteria bacterium]|nr:dihydrofolate reductase [Candidatus Kaiserbacteria bacterium]